MATVNEPPVSLTILIDYWDMEEIGHYELKEVLGIRKDEEGEVVSKVVDAAIIRQLE